MNYEFEMLETIFPRITPLRRLWGRPSWKVYNQITPSNMEENSSMSCQNDQINVGQILTNPYDDLMNIGGTGGHWLPQNMPWWKQILTKILKKSIITRKSVILFIWIIMFHIWTSFMLIHAEWVIKDNVDHMY